MHVFAGRFHRVVPASLPVWCHILYNRGRDRERRGSLSVSEMEQNKTNTDRQTGRQADRQADIQIDRQIDRQTVQSNSIGVQKL